MSIFDRLLGWSDSPDGDDFYVQKGKPKSSWEDIRTENIRDNLEMVRDMPTGELIVEYRTMQKHIQPNEVPLAEQALIESELNARMFEKVLDEGEA